jgi:hypothetical protein
MEQIDTGFIILLAYYGICLLLGCLVPKPKLVFYVLAACGLLVCWVLFQLRIYVEMGGILHTLPWAFVASWISQRIHMRRSVIKTRR